MAVTMEQGSEETLSILLRKYDTIIGEKLGTIKVQLRVKESGKPKFCWVRQVPFSLRLTFNEELDRLEKEGVRKVDISEW